MIIKINMLNKIKYFPYNKKKWKSSYIHLKTVSTVKNAIFNKSLLVVHLKYCRNHYSKFQVRTFNSF